IWYPLFGNWAWGGGWLSQLGANFKLGHGYCDFAGSGVVHAVGGLSALASSMIIGPRIGKFNKDGSPNPVPRHDLTILPLPSSLPSAGSGSIREARSAHRARATSVSGRSP